MDEGGVQKEFFQLITPMLFNKDFGMFVLNEEKRTFWFSNNQFVSGENYELIGKIVAVAIYNGVILDLPFPKVLWRKMMHVKSEEAEDCAISLNDLEDVDPAMTSGLRQMLKFDGDVQETFGVNFAVNYDNGFGELATAELKPGGADIPVTNANREEYVELYLRQLLNVLPQTKLAEFIGGFTKVIGGEALNLLRPEELQLIVEGSPDLDFVAFEKAAVYEDGFNSESPVIKAFWEFAHGADAETQRKLLIFITSSDRAPVGGLKNLRIVISKHGTETNRLPSAHTCFNHLLLPEYEGKEQLEERFRTAIQECSGFHIV